MNIHKFENIFQIKYYSNQRLNYSQKNYEKILGNKIYNKDEIINILSIFSAKLHILNIYQNKFNSFFGVLITYILCKSVLWLIFTPFNFTYKLDFISILLNSVEISFPIFLLIACCAAPETVLMKVSVFLSILLN